MCDRVLIDFRQRHHSNVVSHPAASIFAFLRLCHNIGYKAEKTSRWNAHYQCAKPINRRFLLCSLSLHHRRCFCFSLHCFISFFYIVDVHDTKISSSAGLFPWFLFYFLLFFQLIFWRFVVGVFSLAAAIERNKQSMAHPSARALDKLSTTHNQRRAWWLFSNLFSSVGCDLCCWMNIDYRVRYQAARNDILLRYGWAKFKLKSPESGKNKFLIFLPFLFSG